MKNIKRKRASGILLPISSLPNKRGIGTFGDEAYQFVDFLKKSGQSYWQILPLGHTSFGDSPYQSFSSFAGNPYFIDLDYLVKDGLIVSSDIDGIDWMCDDDSINYGVLYQKRYSILKIAANNFKDDISLNRFCLENDWVNDYALFMTIKGLYNDSCWLSWPKEYRLKDSDSLNKIKDDYSFDIKFWKIIQYLFFKQWFALKEYANNNGIEIIGDCPFYVALDSCDVWSKRENFKLKGNGIPREVAGVPPDFFSSTGQLWGNPLYDWHFMKKNGYSWWLNRISFQLKIYDVLRLDHFIGFSSYYAIKYGSTDAINGKRYKGPGYSLIKLINQKLSFSRLIAEDLGVVSNDVRKLLKKAKYPGMKVLRFAFDNGYENDHLLHNHNENTVAYLTSHDSETCMQWLDEANDFEIDFIKKYCNISNLDDFNWQMINHLQSSNAFLVIIQAQDLLGLGKDARMNLPGVSGINWKWRLKNDQLNDSIAYRLYNLTIENKRI